MRRFRVAILGASGLVSQRMQQRLSNHPWFQLVAVAGQRKGAKLAEIPWYLEQEQTKFIAESDIEILDVNHASLAQKLRDFNVQIVFSALPSKPAFDIEKKLVDAGIHVFSNASAYRMDPDVTPYKGQTLTINDIVVFKDPRDETRICIKRIKRIEDGGIFVEGDNPDPTASTDSHNFGLIHPELLIGFKR